MKVISLTGKKVEILLNIQIHVFIKNQKTSFIQETN